MVAIACHNLPLFKLMFTSCISQGNAIQLPHIYLQKPSQFNGYLRRVIASWVAENAVSIEYVVPQSVQLPLQSFNTPNMREDINQASNKDQDPFNENPATDIHSNDFPVYEDAGHQIPMNQIPNCANDQEKPDEVNEELKEVDDVDASGIENNASADGVYCQVNPGNNIHSNVPVDKDRGHPIPANEVPDYVDYQEKPDDEVSEESNEEVKVSGIEDNASVNDGYCQVNPGNNIHSNVPVDKDRGHQIPANEVPADYQKKPDDEVGEESNEEEVNVSGNKENASVNKKHQCKLCSSVFSRNASLKCP